MKSSKSLLLAESGIMLAFATILSMIEIVKLPFGGGITVFSMLPIILISYRRGVKWGLFTAFAYSLLQLLLGLDNLQMVVSVGAVLAVIFIDYIFAFTVLGLAGIFRSRFKTQAAGITAGTILVCILRYLFHVIVGGTVWKAISIPAADAFRFSAIYNATYMLPETLVTVVGGITLSRMLDIRGETITRAVVRDKAPDLAILFSGIAKTILGAALIADISLVFSKLQNAKTGKFDITQISAVNWPLFISLSICAILLAVLFMHIAKKVPADSAVKLKGLFSAIPAVLVFTAAVFDVLFITNTLKSGVPDKYTIIQIIIITTVVIVGAVLVIRRALADKHKFSQN